jgi:CheY-like chemotaxis protein
MERQAQVLIVEDNMTNMMIFRDILVAAGHQVLEATNADETFELVRLHIPDLILLDIQLPGLDGFEVVRRLKKDPATRGIPVVALTAHAMPTHQERAMEAGCTGYITKPIRSRDFRETVNSLLSQVPIKND